MPRTRLLVSAPDTVGKLRVSVADVLAGSWRSDSKPLEILQPRLDTLVPLLFGSGAGPSAWCRIRRSNIASSPLGFQLQQAYRKHTLEAARHERDIKAIFTLLRSNDIEPTLIKGWSIARLYPEKGMRPYDDTDLVVRSSQFEIAQTIAREQKLTEFDVDLHGELREYGFESEDDFFDHTHLVKLGDVEVRVPALEDSVRLACIHFLRHGAFRPFWLCDVALLVESRPSNFDWDRCLGNNTRIADWIACTIGLAHQLLGARIDDTPVKQRAENLPRWLVPAVLKQWEKPFAKDHGVGRHRAQMASYLRNPSGLFGDLVRRWPNGIEATVYMRGSFNEVPRFPFQIGECISRVARFVARAPKSSG